ncbi:uncharacterized protein LOC117183060 [Belonocnema kinseyi]|uniref:uncharacterized protein LOC117183060 n=1 Tax=Belonocnema kinseyi TaxID=2817044 RepID=UPI00143D29EB|nr:uncharacterized protein LOC117183060 [Belonocnema kinseyi]
MAGQDWLTSFLKRYPRMSIQIPQATSLARATSFNRTTVANYFSLYKATLDKRKIEPFEIYDMGETGFTTDQTPDRIVSRLGSKQIGRITSAERGTLATLELAVSAQGNVVPPFFVFPRKKFKAHFLNGALIGSAGADNPSGWMTAEIFVEYLQHFQRHVNASAQNPVLFLLDNHESHLCIAGLEFCE